MPLLWGAWGGTTEFIGFFSNLASVVSTRTQSVGGTGVSVGTGVPPNNNLSIFCALVRVGTGVPPNFLSINVLVAGIAVGLAVGTLVTPAAFCAHPLSFHELVRTLAAVSV